MAQRKKHEGPRCFVGYDHEAADGKMVCGGWHYSTVMHEDLGEIPDEKLYLDAETGEHFIAQDGDPSWFDQFPPNPRIIAPHGNIGLPHDLASVAATHRHLDEKLERIANDGLDESEADHVLTSPVEISAAKKWLDRHAATLPGGAA